MVLGIGVSVEDVVVGCWVVVTSGKGGMTDVFGRCSVVVGVCCVVVSTGGSVVVGVSTGCWVGTGAVVACNCTTMMGGIN